MLKPGIYIIILQVNWLKEQFKASHIILAKVLIVKIDL